MARTIQSPGVEITERDLSFNTALNVGTNVLVYGFAPQGPTYELIYVTGREDFEQTFFGTQGPTNASERYFYHTGVEILNSPANLLVTRFPYGSGDGIGFDGGYSCLVYPVSARYYLLSGMPIGSAQIGIDFVVGALSADGSLLLSTSLTTFNDATYYQLGTPILTALNYAQYQELINNGINWQNGLNDGADIIENAAFVVVNQGKTTVNENFEGFYLGIADNTTVLAEGYNAIKSIHTVNTLNVDSVIPSNTLVFQLTGDANSAGNISQVTETAPQFDFGQAFYRDSLIMYLYKIRLDLFGQDPTKLQKVPMESFIGTFNPVDTQTNPQNGQIETFNLPQLVSNRSNYLQLIVNKNFAENTKWLYNNVKQVTIENYYEAAKNIGLFKSGKEDLNNKIVGNIPRKMEKSFLLADNFETIPLDIVCEAGLGTQWAMVGGAEGEGFDDTKNVQDDLDLLYDPSDGQNSPLANNYQTIWNLFENFCRFTRKDCMFIADGLRTIFVNGVDGKVLSRLDRNFSQHIYTPLRNLFSESNSNYTAVYANFVKQYNTQSTKFVWLPFSGWAAAIMARMDANLFPWFAPAGLNNGIVRNVVDIAINPNQKQRDLLYKIGTNPVVFFPGDGFVVWGQKTLQSKPSAFDRINVRRLFLTLEKAVYRIARFFVMEPNTVFTRARFVNAIKPLFDLAKQNEGLYDYQIVCDERNNTPDVIDRNELKASIYIKPVRTAEFILIEFVATRTDQDFNELVG